MSGRGDSNQRGRRPNRRRNQEQIRQHQQQNNQPPQQLKSQINYFLNIPKTYFTTTNQPKWTTLHCTPDIIIMLKNVSKAWKVLSKKFLKYCDPDPGSSSDYDYDYNDDELELYRIRKENVKLLVYSYSLISAAQSILWSCENPGLNDCVPPIQSPALHQLDGDLRCHLQLNYPLLYVVRLIAFQYGKVDCPKSGHTIAPFDSLGDIRALIRLASELLSNRSIDDTAIRSKKLSTEILFTEQQIQQAVSRSWLPSYQNDGRFFLILAVGISKFMSLKADFDILPSELAKCMQNKTIPTWWAYFKALLDEQNRNKLDFIFTDWTLDDFMKNLSNEKDLLWQFNLYWPEPDVKHLAFDFDINRELESFFAKTLDFITFLMRDDSIKFTVDKFSHTGSFGQIVQTCKIWPNEPNEMRFYNKFKGNEKQKLALAHAFPSVVICDIECKSASNFGYDPILNEIIESKYEYIKSLSNRAFSKSVFFTPCISTLYANLDSAWIVSWPRYVSNFSQYYPTLNVDTMNQKMRRLMQAMGFLCAAASINKSLANQNYRVIENLFSRPSNCNFSEKCRFTVFQSIFEVATQYGTVVCEETGMQLVPFNVENDTEALIRIALQIMPPNEDNSEPVILVPEAEVKQIIARSWLPTSRGDSRFYFILSRQIAKFLSTDCPISPMDFVKFIHKKQKVEPRPKWWRIFREKLPENCRDRLEFIFSSWADQEVLDNFGDSTGKELLDLLELEWHSPQKEHLLFGKSNYNYNSSHTKHKLEELLEDYFYQICAAQGRNRLVIQENDPNLVNLNRLTVDDFAGSWAQLSDAVNDDHNRRIFHRRIEDNQKRAIGYKYPPEVLYEYVFETDLNQNIN